MTLKVVANRNDALILLPCVDGRISIGHFGQNKVMPDSLIFEIWCWRASLIPPVLVTLRFCDSVVSAVGSVPALSRNQQQSGFAQLEPLHFVDSDSFFPFSTADKVWMVFG